MIEQLNMSQYILHMDSRVHTQQVNYMQPALMIDSFGTLGMTHKTDTLNSIIFEYILLLFCSMSYQRQTTKAQASKLIYRPTHTLNSINSTYFQRKPDNLNRTESQIQLTPHYPAIDTPNTASKFVRTSSEYFSQTSIGSMARNGSKKQLKVSVMEFDKGQQAGQTGETTKRFRRSSSRSFEGVKKDKTARKTDLGDLDCNDEGCLQEKKIFKSSIDKLRMKNTNLALEKEKIEADLLTANRRIHTLQEELQQKNHKLQQMSNVIRRRDTSTGKLQEDLRNKNKQVVELEAIVRKLQQQVQRSADPQVLTPISLDSSHLISDLTSKLKYQEIENHVLKRIRHEKEQNERQVKVMLKENTILKERLRYYVRNKNKHYMEHDQDSNNSSFSLELSQSSPSKRSSLSLETLRSTNPDTLRS